MPQTAIIYARFSTADQSKGLSLERQKMRGMEFAAQHGWAVEAIITDEGRSAFHAANRLEGAALHRFELEATNGLHRGKVLIVENIDRLSRQGAKTAAQLVWKLNEQGVEIATFHDDYIYKSDNNSDMMELFSVIIKAQLAYEESLKKSQRTKATWNKRRQLILDGQHTIQVAHVPAWVSYQDGKYVLDEHRAKVLNEIYDWYLSGHGCHTIVAKLNARGEKTWTKRSEANGWPTSAIYRLLGKRSALGEYVDERGNTLAADFFPQAVTSEKYNRVQAVLAMRKTNQKRSAVQHTNLLTQLVVCRDCGGGVHYDGSNTSTSRYRGKDGEWVRYTYKRVPRIRCDRARRKHACDNDSSLVYATVEQTVLDGMLPLLVNKDQVSQAANALREQIAELGRQKDANDQRLANIVDLLADGASKALMGKMAALESEIAEQESQITALQGQLDVETSKPSQLDDIALIEALRADLESPDPDVRNPTRTRVNIALRRLIQRIDIEPTDTFRIWIDQGEWYLFDAEGTMLESQQVWAAAAE